MKSKPLVVVTDHTFDDVSIQENILRQAGADVKTYNCQSEEDVIAVSRKAHALMVTFAPVTRQVIETLDNCQVIVRYGAGYDNLDVQAATEKGIYIVNVPGTSTEEVADHAMALILQLLRKIHLTDTLVKTGVWDISRIMPLPRLNKLCLGLIGLGKISQAVAKRATPFGLSIIAYDPFVSREVFSDLNIENVEIPDLLKQADIVSLHIPLNEKTRHIISTSELALMKKTAYLINVSRGAVIDEEALIETLRKGQIKGAALDVFEQEPIDPNNPLLKMDNVITTSHTAGFSVEQQLQVQQGAAEEVARVLKGQKPANLINPEAIIE